jgi:pilus assembly protein Flp/PilA
MMIAAPPASYAGLTRLWVKPAQDDDRDMTERWMARGRNRTFVVSHKFWVPRLPGLRSGPVHPAGVETNNNQEVKLKRTVLSFLSDESGATAIEYGLIAAGISLAIIAIVNGLGANINTKFTDINSSLK